MTLPVKVGKASWRYFFILLSVGVALVVGKSFYYTLLILCMYFGPFFKIHPLRRKVWKY